MSTNANIVPAVEGGLAFIEQVAGEEKGKVFELSRDKLTIGRSNENDIVVPSEAISRVHAMLVRSEGAWFIRDNQSKNGIQVNGTQVKECWLQNGDIVQVGNFVFRFNDPTISGAPNSEAPQEEIVAEIPVVGGEADIMAQPKPRKGGSKRILMYGILAIVLVFAYLSTQEPEDKTKKDGDATTAEDSKAPVTVEGKPRKPVNEIAESKAPNMDNDTPKNSIIGKEDPELSKAEKEMKALDWTNGSLREAEQFFKKGQREYLAGNMQRAIEEFQSALSLYRGHRLAERYLQRAIYDSEMLAKENMRIGVQYVDSLQYQRAMYHFNEVIALLSHRQSEAMVSDAKKYIEICKRRLQAAELFP